MRKYLLGLVALLAVAAAGAISLRQDSKENDTQRWYQFTGATPSEASNYELLDDGSVEPDCGEPGSTRCAVKATPHPVLGTEFPNLADPNIQIKTRLP